MFLANFIFIEYIKNSNHFYKNNFEDLNLSLANFEYKLSEYSLTAKNFLSNFIKNNFNYVFDTITNFIDKYPFCQGSNCNVILHPNMAVMDVSYFNEDILQNNHHQNQIPELENINNNEPLIKKEFNEIDLKNRLISSFEESEYKFIKLNNDVYVIPNEIIDIFDNEIKDISKLDDNQLEELVNKSENKIKKHNFENFVNNLDIYLRKTQNFLEIATLIKNFKHLNMKEKFFTTIGTVISFLEINNPLINVVGNLLKNT